MRKVLVLLMVLAMAVPSVFAQDDMGLTVGIDFWTTDLLEEEDKVTKEGGDFGLFISPYVGYDNSFLDDALDVSASLSVTFGVGKGAEVLDKKNKGAMPVDLDLGADIWYHLGLSDASTLSFGLGRNAFRSGVEYKDGIETGFTIAPEPWDHHEDKGRSPLNMTISPAVKFSQGLDFGGIYAILNTPMGIIRNERRNHKGIGVDMELAVGANFDAGLGLELGGYMFLTDTDDSDVDTEFKYMSFLASYATGPIYAHLGLKFPTYDKGFDAEGLTLQLVGAYTLDNSLSFYVGTDIWGIGGDKDAGGDVGLDIIFGFSYSF